MYGNLYSHSDCFDHVSRTKNLTRQTKQYYYKYENNIRKLIMILKHTRMICSLNLFKFQTQNITSPCYSKLYPCYINFKFL